MLLLVNFNFDYVFNFNVFITVRILQLGHLYAFRLRLLYIVRSIFGSKKQLHRLKFIAFVWLLRE